MEFNFYDNSTCTINSPTVNNAKEKMNKAMKAMGEACSAVMEAGLCSDNCPFSLYCCQRIDEEPPFWETLEEFKKRFLGEEND